MLAQKESCHPTSLQMEGRQDGRCDSWLPSGRGMCVPIYCCFSLPSLWRLSSSHWPLTRVQQRASSPVPCFLLSLPFIVLCQDSAIWGSQSVPISVLNPPRTHLSPSRDHKEGDGPPDLSTPLFPSPSHSFCSSHAILAVPDLTQHCKTSAFSQAAPSAECHPHHVTKPTPPPIFA